VTVSEFKHPGVASQVVQCTYDSPEGSNLDSCEFGVSAKWLQLRQDCARSSLLVCRCVQGCVTVGRAMHTLAFKLGENALRHAEDDLARRADCISHDCQICDISK
jgi:hypothetical protein